MEDFTHLFSNTELGIDLKLFTCRPGRIASGKVTNGAIMRDSEDHFTFVEHHQPIRTKLSADPHLYRGTCVNIIGDSPEFRLSFHRPRIRDADELARFCRQAGDELYNLAGLVERKQPEG